MPTWFVLLTTLLFSASSGPGVQLDVPYQSQLDGSPYEAANCGPTAVSMALAYYGVDASRWDVRVRAMEAQGSWVDSEGGYSDSYGTFVHALAAATETYGLRTYGLWQYDGYKVDSLRRWSPEDIRKALENGWPVIVETRYNRLPEHAGSNFDGDHYVIVTGASDDQFVYNDPYDPGTGGPDQVMTAGELANAMDGSSAPDAAFAVYRPPTRASAS